jgi:hypothetical protein
MNATASKDKDSPRDHQHLTVQNESFVEHWTTKLSLCSDYVHDRQMTHVNIITFEFKCTAPVAGENV